MFDFVKSTVGRKYIMGISGLVWMGFVLTHMAGNMLILVGPDFYNAYGHAILSNKPLLYGAESVLVLALIVHVVTAISLTIENRRAKGTRYAVNPNGEKGPTLASQTMGMQGSLVLAFIILHLATFKYGTHYDTTVNGVQMRDLHRLVVEIFQQPGYVLWYVIALIVLMFHLSHGAHSIFQSFGFLERKMINGVRKFAWAYAIIVVAGFLSQPLYVFLLKGN
ncbi:MAG: succinate dehydrogenase cytochrome b subunit [Bdellovibrionota bacterium]